jgi:hypothetical protein
MGMNHDYQGGKKKLYKSGKMWLAAGLVATLGVSSVPVAYSAETDNANPKVAQTEEGASELSGSTYTLTRGATATENGTLYTATPDEPGQPGEHVDPNDTESPIWPDGTDRASLTKDIHGVIHYVYKSGPKAGQTAATDHNDKVTFNRTASFEVAAEEPAQQGTVVINFLDGVTANPVASTVTISGNVGDAYNTDDTRASTEPSLLSQGYIYDGVDGDATSGSFVDGQLVVNYWYYMPSSGTGNQTFSAPAPFTQPMALNTTIQPLSATVSPLTYTDWVALNDDNAFDAVNSPVIQGYTADVKTVPAVTDMTVDSPDFETTVYYTPNKQVANVTYIDDTTGKELAKDAFEGLSDEKMAYTTADRIADYESQGYKLVSDDYPTDATYDHDDTSDQAFVVHLTKEETPTSATPSEPATPGSETPTTPVTPASETPAPQNSSEPATMTNAVTEPVGGVLPYTATSSVTPTVAGVLPYTATTQPTMSGVLPYTAAEKQTKPWVAVGIGVATALSLFAIGTLIANKRRQ